MFNYNIIIIIALFIGLLFIGLDVVYATKCPKERVVYKYIPREDDLMADTQPSKIFNVMFQGADPWVDAVGDLSTRKSQELNKFFVSQM